MSALGSNADINDLVIEEYKSCRDLLSKNIDIMEKNEIFCLGACAIVFGFSLASTVRFVTVSSAWMPLIISTLGFVRFYGLDDTIDKINGYLINVEAKFPSIGWTTYYRINNTAKVLKKTRYGFWIALSLVCLVFGIFMSCPIIPTVQVPLSATYVNN